MHAQMGGKLRPEEGDEALQQEFKQQLAEDVQREDWMDLLAPEQMTDEQKQVTLRTP